MYLYDNTRKDEVQLEFLRDTRKDGKIRPWKDKKMFNMQLSESYERIGYENKAIRTLYCGSYLDFKRQEDGTKKLVNAQFCQVRLCALCSWRREMKIFMQLSKVIEQVDEEKYRYVFLTLTCENVEGKNLKCAIGDLLKSFTRLTRLKRVDKAVKGFFRALEITHDTEKTITKKMYRKSKEYYDSKSLKIGDLNPNYNMYHPHLHVMMLVNKSYFKETGLYITQKEWTSLWQQAMRVSYTPMVDVRAVIYGINKGIKEVAKYTIKDTDFIVEQDKELTDETVKILDDALAFRRLVAYGGIMKEIHSRLNLDKKDTADVYIGDGEEEVVEIDSVIEQYRWHIGFKNYVLRAITEN